MAAPESVLVDPQLSAHLVVNPPSPSDATTSPCSIASAPLRTPEYLQRHNDLLLESRRPDSAHAGTGTPRSVGASRLTSKSHQTTHKSMGTSGLLRSPLSLVDANSPRRRLSGLMATMKLPSTPPQQTQRNWLQVHEILSPRSSPSPREAPPSGFAEMKWAATSTSELQTHGIALEHVERLAASPTKSSHMSPSSRESYSSVDSHSSYEERPGFRETIPHAQLTTEQRRPPPPEPPPREHKPYSVIETFVRRLSGIPAPPAQHPQSSVPALPVHQEELVGRCIQRTQVAGRDGDLHLPGTNRVRSGRRESAPPVVRAVILGDPNGSWSSQPSTLASSYLPDSGSMRAEVSETHVLREHVEFLQRQVKELHEKLAMLDDVEARLALVEVASSLPRSKSLQPRKLISFGFGRKKAARK